MLFIRGFSKFSENVGEAVDDMANDTTDLKNQISDVHDAAEIIPEQNARNLDATNKLILDLRKDLENGRKKPSNRKSA